MRQRCRASFSLPGPDFWSVLPCLPLHHRLLRRLRRARVDRVYLLPVGPELACPAATWLEAEPRILTAARVSTPRTSASHRSVTLGATALAPAESIRVSQDRTSP